MLIGLVPIALYVLSAPWASESARRPTGSISTVAIAATEHPVARPAVQVHAGALRAADAEPVASERAFANRMSDREAFEPVPDAGLFESSAHPLDQVGLEQVVERFMSEQPDEEATQSLHADVAGAITDLAIDGGIEQLSCRTTVCNARLRFASLNEALRLEADGADPGDSRWVSVIDDQAGRLLIDVYWPREQPR